MSVASTFRRVLDSVVGGRGEDSITVPVMDGALKPDDRLDRAHHVAWLELADNVLPFEGGLLVTSGRRVAAIGDDGALETAFEAEAEVSCLATDGAGALAVGMDSKGIRIRGGRHDGVLIEKAGTSPLNCPTAALFLDADRLVVANGSARFSASQWRHDLMHRGSSGSVVLIDLAAGGARQLAEGLAFPAGLCADRLDPSIILVSESWKHRIVSLRTQGGHLAEALAALPAYPGRMIQAGSGGYWLSCFAPRSQLQEFVLREHRYRTRMIAEVDPEFWIAPALYSGRSFKEPLQSGGVIRLGVHKPWAPTRSYGLVVHLDDRLRPVWSLHSRANGMRHGITSLAETGKGLIATSKGRGEVIAIAHTGIEEPDDFASRGTSR